MSNSNLSESVNVRVPNKINGDLEKIAEATDRSKSYIIVRALKTYLMNEGADILNAIKGREQIAEGDSDDIDDVIADMERIIGKKVA
jgi:predicted transcriptional regulator